MRFGRERRRSLRRCRFVDQRRTSQPAFRSARGTYPRQAVHAPGESSQRKVLSFRLCIYLSLRAVGAHVRIKIFRRGQRSRAGISLRRLSSLNVPIKVAAIKQQPPTKSQRWYLLIPNKSAKKPYRARKILRRCLHVEQTGVNGDNCRRGSAFSGHGTLLQVNGGPNSVFRGVGNPEGQPQSAGFTSPYLRQRLCSGCVSPRAPLPCS